MLSPELLSWVAAKDDYLRQLRGLEGPTRTLERLTKIGEEYGEVCDETLQELGWARDAKLATRKPDALGDEIADLLITALLFARQVGVDPSEALARKIRKIEDRGGR